jgi:hypothetical protein
MALAGFERSVCFLVAVLVTFIGRIRGFGDVVTIGGEIRDSGVGIRGLI